ncbi:MAG: ATP-binding cassette domain-containing protein [Terriglobales bacterium]
MPVTSNPSAAPPDAAAPPVPALATIALEGLTVSLAGHTILHGLTCALHGRAIGLLGPNGAGKTTLIHTLLGFYPPASGQAHLLGNPIAAGPSARAAIGYMPERDAFIARMTGVQFLRLMGELSGLPPATALERAHEALFFVGLDEARYRPVETYSSGMKQMAKLAQAIVHGPRLLFLDEPTNGLDPTARRRMIQLIRGLRASGETRFLLSSHLLHDVEECCDEILILRDGRIAAQCDLEAERRTNRRFVFLETQGGEAAAFWTALQQLGCVCATQPGNRGRVVLPEGVDAAEIFRAAARHQVQLRRFEFKRDSLEEIFLRAMNHPAAPAGAGAA